MIMPKTKPELPEITESQLKLLNAYRELEREIGSGPSLQSLLDVLPGLYSHRSGVQKAIDALDEMGLIVKPQWTDGSTTELGRAALARARRRKLI
jgi:hypothetical protein